MSGQPWYSHSFKHSFSFPASSAEAAGKLAGEGAAAAGSGAAMGGGHPFDHGFRGRMHGYGGYHGGYHGRGWYGRPRFGFMRRFFWFGFGATAATMWIHHKQRKDEEARSIGWGSFSEYCRHPHGHAAAQAPVQPVPVDFSHDTTPTFLSQRPAIAQPAPQQPVVPEIENKKRGWKSWSERHAEWHQRRDALRAAQVAQASQAAQSAPAPATQPPAAGPADSSIIPGDELERAKASFLALYEEKKRQATEAQTRANEKAREFTKQKLESLTAALEAMRDKLDQQEAEEKKRMV